MICTPPFLPPTCPWPEAALFRLFTASPSPGPCPPSIIFMRETTASPSRGQWPRSGSRPRSSPSSPPRDCPTPHNHVRHNSKNEVVPREWLHRYIGFDSTIHDVTNPTICLRSIFHHFLNRCHHLQKSLAPQAVFTQSDHAQLDRLLPHHHGRRTFVDERRDRLMTTSSSKITCGRL